MPGSVTIADANNISAVSTDSSGAPAVNITSSDTITVKQEYEVSAVQDYDRFTLGAAAGSVDTWDISIFDEVRVSLASDGTTDPITIYASVDGTNFDAIPCEARDTTGAYVAATWTSTANGQLFIIPFNARKLRFTKTGTTDTFTVSWSARNSGRSAV